MNIFKKALCVALTAVMLTMGGGESFVFAAYEDIVAAYVDDKINISNEAFYGEYDEALAEWIQPGYFDYDNYPAMRPIREAARIGDYDLAKEEALEYYRTIYKEYTRPIPSAPHDTDELFITLMQNNIQLNSNSNYGLYGILTFEKTASWKQLNMEDNIDLILDRPDKQMTIYLMGLKKDGTSVSIESKDAGLDHSPYLEITSKGVTEKIYPSDDATISPAENRYKNFNSGTDKAELLVEESISSIGTTIPVDQNTKRSFLKFDLSKIDPSVALTRAVLNLYGVDNGSGTGEVVVMRFPSNAWSEDTVTWYLGDNGDPIEHGVFSDYGKPSFVFVPGTQGRPKLQDFDVDFCSYRYPEELARFSWQAYYTRVYMDNQESNDHIAHDFLRHWVGYLDQHGNTPRWESQLDGSVRDYSVPNALFYMIHSSAMTPELWSATLKHFWIELETNTRVADSNNNYRTYQSMGLAALLSYFKEFAIYDRGFTQLEYLIESNFSWMVNDDGSSIEAAPVYAAVGVEQLLQIIIYFNYAGIKAIPISDELISRVKNLTQYLLNITMPGMNTSQWGDSGGYSPGTNALSNLQNFARIYNVPDVLYAASGGTEGTKPVTPNAVRYSDNGVHVMRSGWDESDFFLFTDNDGGSGNHSHKDDLSAILYAYGQYLLTDQSFYSYTTVNFDLRDTSHHNVVLFNDTNQAKSGTMGQTKRFEGNSAYDNFTLSTTAYEPGLKYTRNFLFIKPHYFIINDYLVPSNQLFTNNYKQNWHMLPAANPSVDSYSFAGKSSFSDTANIHIVQANVQNMSPPEVVNSYFSLGNNTLYNSKKLRFEKNSAGNVLFDTVLYPAKKGENAEVSAQPLPLANVQNNGATAMYITIDSSEKYAHAEYYLVHDYPAQKQERVFGTNLTDGRSAYVEHEKNNRVTKFFLQDAKTLQDTGRGITFFQSEDMIPEFAATFEAYQVKLETPPDTDLTKLTVYADNQSKVTTVYHNGKSIPFNLAGRYLYFGEEPILNGGSFETDTCPGGGSPDFYPTRNGGINITAPLSNTAVSPPSVALDMKIPEAYRREIESHWGKDELSHLVSKGILKGTDEKTLNLDGLTTRAEFTALLLRALGTDKASYSGLFDDVSESDWFAGYVQAAKDANLIDGAGNRLFAPCDITTREQAAKILTAAFTRFSVVQSHPATYIPFSDEDEISEWAAAYVRRAQEIGIMKGDDTGAFKPLHGLTRAEAAIIVGRLSKLITNSN